MCHTADVMKWICCSTSHDDEKQGSYAVIKSHKSDN